MTLFNFQVFMAIAFLSACQGGDGPINSLSEAKKAAGIGDNSREKNDQEDTQAPSSIERCEIQGLPAIKKICGPFGVSYFYRPRITDRGELDIGEPSNTSKRTLATELKDLGATPGSNICAADPISVSGGAQVYLFVFSGWGTPAADAAEKDRRASIEKEENEQLKAHLQRGCRVYVPSSSSP